MTPELIELPLAGPTDIDFRVGDYLIRTRIAKHRGELARDSATLYTAFRVLAWQVDEQGQDILEGGVRRGLIDHSASHTIDDLSDRVEKSRKPPDSKGNPMPLRDAQDQGWHQVTYPMRKSVASRCHAKLVNVVEIVQELPEDDGDEPTPGKRRN